MSPRNSRATRTPFKGLATGSAIAIVCAALFTGALISVHGGQISWPFLVLFALAGIVVTTLVNPRGLFLTVALLPLLFLVAVTATGWAISSATSNGSAGVSRTDVVVIFYPLLQLFPVLAATTIGALVIALARLSLLKRHNETIARRERAERHRLARSNRRTTSQGRRARERTLTVSELRELMAQRERETSRGGRR